MTQRTDHLFLSGSPGLCVATGLTAQPTPHQNLFWGRGGPVCRCPLPSATQRSKEGVALLAALTTERPPRRLVGHPPLFGLPELIRDLQRLEQ